MSDAQRHTFACLQFADGVALMTRRNFAEAYRRLSEAYDILLALHHDPNGPDALHVDLFRNVVRLAANQTGDIVGTANLYAASGMLCAWGGCKSSALGADIENRHSGLTAAAFDHYERSVAAFEQAIPLLEAGLGVEHPDLLGPLGGYSGSLRAVGREAEAEYVYQRMLALPPSTLSREMVGGGYPIIMLDPFGTNTLLPSETL